MTLRALMQNYELLLNRSYKNNEASSKILEELDSMLIKNEFQGSDVQNTFFEKWKIANDLRSRGYRNIDYKKSLGRRINVTLSPYEDHELLQACAYWGFVPIERKLRESIRGIALTHKQFDVSITDQRISEAINNSGPGSSTFSFEYQPLKT